MRNGSMSIAGRGDFGGPASTNLPSAIDATFVNRHSSSCVVGNPIVTNWRHASSRKRANPSAVLKDRAVRSRSAAYESRACAMSASRRSLSDSRRFEPAVPSLFQLERKFLAASADDPAVRQDVHFVGHDVVEEALIVGHQQERAI